MKKGAIVEGIEIVDIGAKGKVIGKKDGVAYLTSEAIPGDVVSMQIRKNKKGMKEGRVMQIETPSKDRVVPVCAHFQHCGGCNWQNLDYERQIQLKERNVHQQIHRIGGIPNFEADQIKGADSIYTYRNKLEFTFVSQRWLTPDEIQKDEQIEKGPALGFHVPGRFDWVLHIDQCHLQDDYHNAIRNFIYNKSIELGLSFYHPREQNGTMRNLVLRSNRAGDWMVLLIIKEDQPEIETLLLELQNHFPQIKSLWVIINNKMNDSYNDCPIKLIHGSEHLVETFSRTDGTNVDYLIGPKSFFQTNPDQAEFLYKKVYEWAAIGEDDIVYDLYTGTGSIALFVSDKAKKVIGVEYVQEAIDDAHRNAALNGITNCSFFAGDMKDILTAEFIKEHGNPSVLITDPPRAGMHQDVVNRILEAAPGLIVYVSCDPATQARDLALLKVKYELSKIQPVDMFPHTSHVENIALLKLR